jgi:hypothetical protein
MLASARGRCRRGAAVLALEAVGDLEDAAFAFAVVEDLFAAGVGDVLPKTTIGGRGASPRAWRR